MISVAQRKANTNMPSQKDYSGQVLNHWWLVSDRHYDKISHIYTYTLTNQANGLILDRVRQDTIERILSGKEQVSTLQSKRLIEKNITSNAEWW